MKVSFKNLYKKSIKEEADKSRLAAVELVFSVLEEKSFSNLSLAEILDGKNLGSKDRKFATAIAYNTINLCVNLDSVIAHVSSIKEERIDPYIKSILRTALWQVFCSDKIPDFAVCDESVKLAKLSGNKGAVSYVNAVLRTTIKEKNKLKDKYFTNPKQFHLKCSMPPETAEYFRKWFGGQRAIDICRSMNDSPLVTLRVNKLKTNPEYIKKILEEEGMEVFESEFADLAFRIKTGGLPVEKLDLFRKGYVTVQDESSMLVSLIAEPQPGQTVIDTCSAPGGKAFHMADLMKNKGRIYAVDINPSRIELIEKGVLRLGIENIKTMIGDAENYIGQILPEPADLVLADVPCSGLGIIRKKPEIKFSVTCEKLISLYDVQKKIILNASKLVKKGGFLVYSTCTLNPDENEGVVKGFLEKNENEFETVSFADNLPEKFIKQDPKSYREAHKGMMTVYPDIHKSDGFFMAKLRRKH